MQYQEKPVETGQMLLESGSDSSQNLQHNQGHRDIVSVGQIQNPLSFLSRYRPTLSLRYRRCPPPLPGSAI